MNRVVTGYDSAGQPAVIRQGEPPVVIRAGRYTTTELWVSERGPIAPAASDNSAREWQLEPPPGGACFRIVEIAPAASGPGATGDPDHDDFQGTHATDTLDYVTILSGEVTLLVGDTKVVLRPGDSVVQQPGVPHDWQNRSSAPVVMVGILLSAR